MKVLVTADTHFGHKALYERHNRIQGFEDVILQGLIRANRSGADLLIHLGDFCWKHPKDWHEAFMATIPNIKHKILVRGNHDYESNKWYLDHGWSFVADKFYSKYFGKNLVFTHEPVLQRIGDFNIHGHLHGKAGRHHWPEFETCYDDKYHIDAAVDDNQYRPYDLEELLSTYTT